jgi:hypothetical protein
VKTQSRLQKARAAIEEEAAAAEVLPLLREQLSDHLPAGGATGKGQMLPGDATNPSRNETVISWTRGTGSGKEGGRARERQPLARPASLPGVLAPGAGLSATPHPFCTKHDFPCPTIASPRG